MDVDKGMFNDYNKIIRVLDSCKTLHHVDVAKNMFELWKKKYEKVCKMKFTVLIIGKIVITECLIRKRELYGE